MAVTVLCGGGCGLCSSVDRSSLSAQPHRLEARFKPLKNGLRNIAQEGRTLVREGLLTKKGAVRMFFLCNNVLIYAKLNKQGQYLK